MEKVRGYAFDVLSQVTVPKQAVVINWKLGLLLKVMQAGSLVCVAFIIFHHKDKSHKPSEMQVTMWQEVGEAGPEIPEHCNDTQSFHYNYSSTWSYAPQRCGKLPRGEDFQRDLTEAFFATYVMDDYLQVNGEYGSADCSSTASSCQVAGGKFSLDAPGSCNCLLKSDQFYHKNVEKKVLMFRHAYIAPDSYDGKSHQRGSSAKDFYTTDKHPGDEVQGKLLTIIKDENGTECKVHGKSKFRSGDDGDINGAVEDWLACGGVRLDDRRDETSSGFPEESSKPHLRTTGVMITLDFQYKNVHPLIVGDVSTGCEIWSRRLRSGMDGFPRSTLPLA